MRHLFFLTVLTICQTVLAQDNYELSSIGLTANGGLSKVSTNYSSTGWAVNNNIFRFSGHAGLFYNLHITENSSIETALLFTQVEGKEHQSFQLHDSVGNPWPVYFVDNYYRHITYLGLPIQYGLQVKRFTIAIGGQLSFALLKNERHEYYTSYPKSEPDPRNENNKLNIDSFDYGIKGGLLFNLTEKFTLETTFYQSLNNIYKNNEYTWTIQQWTVGLRYKFFVRQTVCITRQ